ncbi:bis(5'-nucleosyl)-tetraphosphatase (symmetrical) YqeK [Enterococcus sp. LJL99]
MKQLDEYVYPLACSENLEQQVKDYLNHFGKTEVFEHSKQVAVQAEKLANKFTLDSELAYRAGLLHDISAVIPNDKRIAVQKEQDEVIYEAEYQVPMLLHQRQSVYIAQKFFGITKTEVLSAIRCHTTLKAGATDLDKCVFIADKIAWDRKGVPPYDKALKEALEKSLDDGVRVYIDWLCQGDLLVMHPWLAEVRQELGV